MPNFIAIPQHSQQPLPGFSGQVRRLVRLLELFEWRQHRPTVPLVPPFAVYYRIPCKQYGLYIQRPFQAFLSLRRSFHRFRFAYIHPSRVPVPEQNNYIIHQPEVLSSFIFIAAVLIHVFKIYCLPCSNSSGCPLVCFFL